MINILKMSQLMKLSSFAARAEVFVAKPTYGQFCLFQISEYTVNICAIVAIGSRREWWCREELPSLIQEKVLLEWSWKEVRGKEQVYWKYLWYYGGIRRCCFTKLCRMRQSSSRVWPALSSCCPWPPQRTRCWKGFRNPLWCPKTRECWTLVCEGLVSWAKHQ